jgi:hypothetical protein
VVIQIKLDDRGKIAPRGHAVAPAWYHT